MRIFVALLFFSLASSTLGAVDLRGSVRTDDGRPIPHLVLVLKGPSGPRTVLTGPAGRYQVSELVAGHYRLRPRSDSFQSESPGEIELGTSDADLDLVLGSSPLEEEVVVTAARTEAVASTLGVSTSLLDRDDINSFKRTSVLDLLQTLPGLTVARNGGLGSQGSVFIRGGESDFARVLVDGVPVNQPGGGFDFGSLLPLELDRIEVVRGAASSLYGTDALAGVVQLFTRRGQGETPIGRVEAEGGSNSYQRFLLGTSGSLPALDWNLGAQTLETDNEIPNSGFESDGGALSLRAGPDESISLRATLRIDDSLLGTPGAVAYGRPDLDAFFDRQDLVTGVAGIFAQRQAQHEVRLGWAQTEQVSVNPEDSGPYLPTAGDMTGSFPVFDFVNPVGFRNDTERLSLGYRGEFQIGERHLLSGGGDFERETGSVGDVRDGLLEPERDTAGIYLQDRVFLGERVFLTVGGRVDENDSFGTFFAPRAVIAWESGRGRVLKGSAGLGVKEPSFFESFGASFFARGNPDLLPEKSATFDLSLSQRLAQGRVELEATLFQHDYEDQIAFDIVDFVTFEGTFVNLGETRARGLELGLRASPLPSLRVRADYTWLDGEILVSGNAFSPLFAAGQSLLRRPEHAGGLTVERLGKRVHFGGTLRVVGRYADSDFLGIGLVENSGYTRVDLRVRGELTESIELFAVLDNAFDEEYEEALGFPALGSTARVGVSLRLGGGI